MTEKIEDKETMTFMQRMKAIRDLKKLEKLFKKREKLIKKKQNEKQATIDIILFLNSKFLEITEEGEEVTQEILELFPEEKLLDTLQQSQEYLKKLM